MSPTNARTARTSALVMLAMVAAAFLTTPPLLAQNTATVQVSATVISVDHERDAAQQAQAMGLRLTSGAGQPQAEVSQRVSTVSRLAQVTSERVRLVGNSRGEQADAVWVRVEYPAN